MGRSAASRKALLVSLGGALSIAAGCTKSVGGSGNVISTPVPVSGFSRLEVSNTFDVDVSFGDKESLTLRVDDTLVGHLDWGCQGRCTWAWSVGRPCTTRRSTRT